MKAVLTVSVQDAKRLESFAFAVIKFLHTHKEFEAIDNKRLKKAADVVFGPECGPLGEALAPFGKVTKAPRKRKK